MDGTELDYKKIGQRVKNARNKLGWKQEELAHRVGITTSHMSHIETGQTKVALPTIVKIANALSVSVDELLCDSLQHAYPVFNQQIADAVSDCSAAEIQAVIELMN